VDPTLLLTIRNRRTGTCCGCRFAPCSTKVSSTQLSRPSRGVQRRCGSAPDPAVPDIALVQVRTIPDRRVRRRRPSGSRNGTGEQSGDRWMPTGRQQREARSPSPSRHTPAVSESALPSGCDTVIPVCGTPCHPRQRAAVIAETAPWSSVMPSPAAPNPARRRMPFPNVSGTLKSPAAARILLGTR
jgi:hypothetical protein